MIAGLIEWQSQPTEKTCGQTCVAMVLGISAGDVIIELGAGPTRAVHLAAFLRSRGVPVAHMAARCYGDLDSLPSVALLNVEWIPKQSNGHWILWADGFVLDPMSSVVGLEIAPPVCRRSAPRILTRGAVGRVVSCLSIVSASPTLG